MLNTIGLWIVLISSVLVFILMLLYANGIFAKGKKSILERRKTRAKKKKKEEDHQAKETLPLVEKTETERLDNANSMRDLQSIFWEKKLKKAKREDNSLMGDLFGWAGIAANDEDFSIPGFFTPAKKQGA
jgi:hypothetical protein